ncbi:FAD/NADP-binding domain-containing protein [Gigaspora margarita]|uniref:Cholesterol oxidase n=2 Tax=Gigaspora margarita TaxID=4874 RepID=A0A8H3XKT2_GIGMA|nr:FAD/NADP-binding domain-containing protein [Gigaspora margarita]
MASEQKFPLYPHISLPMTEMRPHYEVVVIGSGYGGGIAASRMSRAGKRVALLERGEERWPGEYPSKFHECIKEVQYDSVKKHIGKKSGMYHIYNGNNQDAVVACGLGGTSLINANVALEADDRIWQMPFWPDEIKNDMKSIKMGYARAREMLQPVPYPKHFPELPKLKVLEEQAKRLGSDYLEHFYRPPITVTFENRVNAAGVRQLKSTLTGNDCTGVNDSSKNSTLMNYIPDAWNHGCEIFCEIYVQRIKKDKETGKWIIFYKWLNKGHEKFYNDDNQPLFFVMADTVFLAAGTIGTNEILLRSRICGLEISPQLGMRFSGNGDIVGFGYNTDLFCNGIAMGEQNPLVFKNGPVGPCITGIIDMRKSAENVLEGFVIEEGVCPIATAHSLSVVSQATGIFSPDVSFTQRILKSTKVILSRFSKYNGALANTQTYLIMSHDDNSGRLQLENDKVKIEYKGVGSAKTVEKLNKTLELATAKINGAYVPSPFWMKTFGKGLITVHPIGGCCMGKKGDDGVVNHKGQVYKGKGTEVYDDLYLCDGSIVPAALGVNPFLTISCLAERIMKLAAEDRGLKIDYELVKQPIDWNNPIKKWPSYNVEAETALRNNTGNRITFNEFMKGYFSTEVHSTDYRAAEYQAKSSASTMQFTITVVAQNEQSLYDMEEFSAEIVGTVSCRALSPDPLIIDNGKFRLFVNDKEQVDSRAVMYNFNLLATNGKKYRFKGFKTLLDTNVFTAWDQVTTLYVTVFDCTEEDENEFSNIIVQNDDDDMDINQEKRKVIGRGILYVELSSFLKQLSTLRAIGCSSRGKRNTLFSFFKYFSNIMMEHAFARFRPLSYPGRFPIARPFYHKHRPQKETWTIVSDDNVETLIHRFKGGLKGPVLLIHGVAMSHEMWTTNLVKDNLLDYLLENEYDVWLNDYRLSPTNPECYKQHTLDAVKLDQKAAINHVRKITECDKIAVLAHCMGCVATLMGILDGSIEGVGSLITSQVSLYPINGIMDRVKRSLKLVPLWRYVFKQNIFDVRTSPDTDLLNFIINQLLRFYPVPRGQGCNNALCHRASFCYGTLFQHENINQEVHDHMDEFFGAVNITTMSHLMTISKAKKIVDFNGNDIYVTEENIKKRLDFPMFLVHGDKNVVFDIVATRMSYDTLIKTNAHHMDQYRIFEAPGYGHVDCLWGNKAYKEIFPEMLKHLEDTRSVYGYGMK